MWDTQYDEAPRPHVPLAVCDFCTQGQMRWVYLVGSFRIDWKPPVLLSDCTYEAGGWAACRACAQLVDRGDLAKLVKRAVRIEMAKSGLPAGILHRHFQPIFEQVLRLKTARKTPEETRDLQGYADEPIGVQWNDLGVRFIMPSVPPRGL